MAVNGFRLKPRRNKRPGKRIRMIRIGKAGPQKIKQRRTRQQKNGQKNPDINSRVSPTYDVNRRSCAEVLQSLVQAFQAEVLTLFWHQA